jgi:hypothetical protein
MLPPLGSGRVTARCQANACGPVETVDVTGWHPATDVPDVGLRPIATDCGPSGTW